MDMKEICPCPNQDCPNHGDCEKCISRHLKKGYLNYCAFHTILPLLREAIDADPDSPAAQKLIPWSKASSRPTPDSWKSMG